MCLEMRDICQRQFPPVPGRIVLSVGIQSLLMLVDMEGLLSLIGLWLDNRTFQRRFLHSSQHQADHLRGSWRQKALVPQNFSSVPPGITWPANTPDTYPPHTWYHLDYQHPWWLCQQALDLPDAGFTQDSSSQESSPTFSINYLVSSTSLT